MWKDVIGFEGFYQVSDAGEVRSVDRTRSVSDSMGRTYQVSNKGKLIAQRRHKDGYPVVTLSKENVQCTRTVHRLLAEAFLGPANGRVVRHLDGDATRSVLSNLAYGTQADNLQDAADHGTLCVGEGRPNAKLSAESVIQIRREKALGARNVDLARKYDISEVCVFKVVTGKSWVSIDGVISKSKSITVLSDRERGDVPTMRSAGMTLQQIADAKGVSVGQIRNVLKELT